MGVQTWARSFEVPIGAARSFTVGPLRLFARRGAHEWELGALHLDDAHASEVVVDRPEQGLDLGVCPWRVRYPAPSHVDHLTLTPIAADRPVIARPESTLLVPAGASTVVFLGSPVWVGVSLGEARVGEIPGWRPSDTWFGPSSTEGELCYASRTMARLSLDELVPSPIRALTHTTIVNATDEPVPVDRIGLPLPAMSIFCARDGRMWTETVQVELEQGGASPTRVERAPPALAGDCRRLASPRRPPDSAGLVRAFSALVDISKGHAWSG